MLNVISTVVFVVFRPVTGILIVDVGFPVSTVILKVEELSSAVFAFVSLVHDVMK